MDRAEDAAVLLKPEHQRLLDLLSTPNSASGLARELGWSRQIVNYHLKELERAGCIALQEERKRGNCIERVMRRTAAAYLIGPQTLGNLSADPARVADKLSASYLIAVAGRTIREVSRIGRAAEKAGKIVPTLTLDTEIRFRSPGERQAFTAELTAQVAALVRKYHDDKSPQGRRFRVVTGAYPLISTNTERSNEGNGTNDDGNAAA
jgi:biotin operon repressor